jgi:hypothetical protein
MPKKLSYQEKVRRLKTLAKKYGVMLKFTGKCHASAQPGRNRMEFGGDWVKRAPWYRLRSAFFHELEHIRNFSGRVDINEEARAMRTQLKCCSSNWERKKVIEWLGVYCWADPHLTAAKRTRRWAERKWRIR